MFTIPTLTSLLSVQRPHDSKAETLYARTFIDSVPGMSRDRIGNRILRIGDAPIMYSCHIDTVHAHAGPQTVTQSKGIIRLASAGPSCLGADDAAGIYLMLRMIDAQIPGLYIFHRGEERGGIGSSWIAKNTPEFLSPIKAAIAFDRADYHSIITHQGGARTASDDFADSLASMLSLGHIPDATGIFTDTALYEHIIPECSNISVGYFQAHSSDEYLDVTYLAELAEALTTKFDPHSLVISRDPLHAEPLDDWWLPGRQSYVDSLTSTIRDNPEAIADLLQEYGVGEDEIYQYLYDNRYIR